MIQKHDSNPTSNRYWGRKKLTSAKLEAYIQMQNRHPRINLTKNLTSEYSTIKPTRGVNLARILQDWELFKQIDAKFNKVKTLSGGADIGVYMKKPTQSEFASMREVMRFKNHKNKGRQSQRHS